MTEEGVGGGCVLELHCIVLSYIALCYVTNSSPVGSLISIRGEACKHDSAH
jgi:hypothetical protein